jgi:hypothetical protein
LTERVNEALPAAAVLGESDVIAGTGLAAGLTTNVSTFDSPLFPAPEKGFKVLTKTVPGLAIIAVVIAAVTLEALTYVVGTVFPFHWTTVCVTKPPLGLLTVSVKGALPALAAEGARKLMDAPVGF